MHLAKASCPPHHHFRHPAKNLSRSDRDLRRAQVTSKEGFFCTIRLAAVLPLTPAETFELLARPDSHNIFRSITVRLHKQARPIPGLI